MVVWNKDHTVVLLPWNSSKWFKYPGWEQHYYEDAPEMSLKRGE